MKNIRLIGWTQEISQIVKNNQNGNYKRKYFRYTPQAEKRIKKEFSKYQRVRQQK